VSGPAPPPWPRGRANPRQWALAGFARLPVRVRLWVIRRVAPSHHVGALCLVEHDGRLLMLRQSHRWGWTLPGGLLDRGEAPDVTARREVAEETGLQVEPGLPFGVVVDTDARRVDVLFWVPVDHRPRVSVASEALEAAWLTREEAGAVDEPTAQALWVLQAFRQPGAQAGRLLDPPP
jgi:8-oxo-dGTP diphosphatase